MKKAVYWLKNFGIILLLMLFVSACGAGNGAPASSAPWTAAPTADTWLTSNPYDDFHDGGWVYSAREDVLYSMYGHYNNGQTLFRINYIAQTASNPVVWSYNRHGSHPVIDSDGVYVYQPPSESTNQLERWNTETSAHETLAAAPYNGSYSHGVWKNGLLWIVLNDHALYSYDPVGNSWSARLASFGNIGNVAASAASSNLIYIILYDGDLYSYDTVTTTVTSLSSNPNGYDLDGNAQFVWFSAGSTTGYLYAASGCDYEGPPAVYDIANDTWHNMTNPVDMSGENCNGHATYDTTRDRLYVVDGSDGGNVYYYQF